MGSTRKRTEPGSVQAARLLLGSFASAILVGTVLLMLPAASADAALSWTDALFTATSAVCVTGLIVVDTATRLSTFGQSVVLVLLQIGGLGIMTLTTFFAYLIAGRVSVRGRELLEETISGPFSRPGRLLLAIVSFALLTELVGALILTLRFSLEYPLGRAIWLGSFHAVSAFCNAGFSLFSDSLMRYASDPTVNLTVAALIVLGGIGFLVVYDLTSLFGRNRSRRLSLHTRIVLRTTLGLIVAGAVLIFAFERSSALASLPMQGKLLASLFQSITARTAGFNTLNIANLTNASLLLLIMLMFIGASPGSCGGGIKTTTFATVLCLVRDRARNRTDVVVMNRRVREALLSKALTVFFLSMGLVLVATIGLLASETSGLRTDHADFVRYLFEATSAFGTVGLSTGVTPHLSQVGKLIVVTTMFVGRLGPATLALTIGASEVQHFRYPEGDFLVG